MIDSWALRQPPSLLHSLWFQMIFSTQKVQSPNFSTTVNLVNEHLTALVASKKPWGEQKSWPTVVMNVVFQHLILEDAAELRQGFQVDDVDD